MTGRSRNSLAETIRRDILKRGIMRPILGDDILPPQDRPPAAPSSPRPVTTVKCDSCGQDVFPSYSGWRKHMEDLHLDHRWYPPRLTEGGPPGSVGYYRAKAGLPPYPPGGNAHEEVRGASVKAVQPRRDHVDTEIKSILTKDQINERMAELSYIETEIVRRGTEWSRDVIRRRTAELGDTWNQRQREEAAEQPETTVETTVDRDLLIRGRVDAILRDVQYLLDIL